MRRQRDCFQIRSTWHVCDRKAGKFKFLVEHETSRARVDRAGFEPAISALRMRHSYQAELPALGAFSGRERSLRDSELVSMFCVSRQSGIEDRACSVILLRFNI